MEQPTPGFNLAALLRIPFQALVDELHKRLADEGYGDIRPAYTIIFAILGPEGMPLSELTARAQTTKQVMNYLVNAVEELGYVERVPDPTDGRAKIVRLTERGLKQSRLGREIIFGIEREWAEMLGKEEMRELRSLLERLVGVVLEMEKERAESNGNKTQDEV
jgi:DNA-binding MarR family transcriptional regulator